MSLRVVVKIITMRVATDRRWVRTKQTEMGIMETNDPRVALNHSFESGTKLMSSILNAIHTHKYDPDLIIINHTDQAEILPYL